MPRAARWVLTPSLDATAGDGGTTFWCAFGGAVTETLNEGQTRPMMMVAGPADEEEAEGEGFLVGELGVVAFPYGGADWTALLCEVFLALVFGEPNHRVTPLVEAPAFAALVHEVVRQAFLLPFADGTGGLCAHYAADWLLEGGRPCARPLFRWKR